MVITLQELKDKLQENNTHIVDGKICLGGMLRDSPVGIGFERGYDKKILWGVPNYKLPYINKIEEEEVCNDKKKYTIYLDGRFDDEEIEIIAYNRKNLNTIPLLKDSVEDNVLGNLSEILCRQMFDDDLSFISFDKQKKKMIIVALDLYKVRGNQDFRDSVIKIMDKVKRPSIIIKNNKSYTLCCVVDLDNRSYSYAKLDIDKMKIVEIESDIHTNENINDYIKQIVKMIDEISQNGNSLRSICDIINY